MKDLPILHLFFPVITFLPQNYCNLIISQSNCLKLVLDTIRWYLRLAQALLTGLVSDAGKLRRLSCSEDDFIYFLPVAASSLRAGFQVYLSKLWVVDVTKAVRYDLLIYCLLSDIILYFLLVA